MRRQRSPGGPTLLRPPAEATSEGQPGNASPSLRPRTHSLLPGPASWPHSSDRPQGRGPPKGTVGGGMGACSMWGAAKGSWIVPRGALVRMASLSLAAPTGCGEGPSRTRSGVRAQWAAPAGYPPRGALRRPFPARGLSEAWGWLQTLRPQPGDGAGPGLPGPCALPLPSAWPLAEAQTSASSRPSAVLSDVSWLAVPGRHLVVPGHCASSSISKMLVLGAGRACSDEPNVCRSFL